MIRSFIMRTSNFQFFKPELKRLIFSTNDNFSQKGPVNMNTEISVNIQRAKENPSNRAYVYVTLCVGDKENIKTPFYIEAEEGATFQWVTDAFSEGQIESLLNQNSVVLLRPIISTLTAASKFPSFNLPYIDLTSKINIDPDSKANSEESKT